MRALCESALVALLVWRQKCINLPVRRKSTHISGWPITWEAMKRKRLSDDLKTCDLVLTDASGRSVRAHRALLMDRSEYFARLLNEHDLKEMHLDENYLVELIHFLYSQESDYADQDLARLDARLSSGPPGKGATGGGGCGGGNCEHQAQQRAADDVGPLSPVDTSLISGDLEILMNLLVLARKYSFRQLGEIILAEINYQLGPLTAVVVYNCATELDLPELRAQARMMILSCLPLLQAREDYLGLSREAIYDIFSAEDPSIEFETKLDALSTWWSRNKSVDLTDLWASLMMSSACRSD